MGGGPGREECPKRGVASMSSYFSSVNLALLLLHTLQGALCPAPEHEAEQPSLVATEEPGRQARTGTTVHTPVWSGCLFEVRWYHPETSWITLIICVMVEDRTVIIYSGGKDI